MACPDDALAGRARKEAAMQAPAKMQGPFFDPCRLLSPFVGRFPYL
jgi:hypothetical protein